MSLVLCQHLHSKRTDTHCTLHLHLAILVWRQDAAISLVLSEAVYKQLDDAGAHRATEAVSELLQQYPMHMGLRLMGIRWEHSEIGYQCAQNPS